MLIAVFGSSASKSVNVVGHPVPDPARFESFCRRLGGVLVRGANSVLVESDSPRSADRWVVEGMLDIARAGDALVTVFHRAERDEDEPFQAARARHVGLFELVSLRESVLTSTHLQMLERADAAIVIGGGKNAYTAGKVAASVGVRLIPVPAFRGAGESLWQDWGNPVPQPAARLPAPENWTRLTGTEEEILDAIAAEVDAFPRVMLVHGRSEDRLLVREILTAAGVQAPIVLRDRLSAGSAIPEKFEREARQADAAVVLFTPDEEVASLLDTDGRALGAEEIRARARARQNVAVEFGWFWGRLGRDHVLLL